MPSIKLDDSRYNTFFITLKTNKNVHVFTSKKYFNIILNSLDYCQKDKGMQILAYAILSNHLHLVFRIKENIVLRDLIRDFKHFTANQIIELLKQDNQLRILNIFQKSARELKDRKHKVWRRTTHPEVIYSDKFLEQKIKYVDINAVHHRIVNDPIRYLYTSFHNHYQHVYPECKVVLKII